MASPPKWYTIAKNEYRIRTSAVRSVRPYLLPLLAAVLVLYVVWIAPTLLGSAVPVFLAFLLSRAALATMELFLLTCFSYCLVIPLTNALRDIRVQEQEILLATPVGPGEVLLGKFLGVLPLYTVGFVLILGAFTALLAPAGLDGIQLVLTVAIIFLVLLSALWIGVVAAAILRTRLERSARGRDVGKALGFLLALPIVALTYAFMGGLLSEATIHPEANPTVAAILAIFPSSWGADVVMALAAHPGNLAALGLADVVRLLGLVAFFLAALGLGAVAANRAYRLEAGTFTAVRARADGAFYRSLRALGGHTHGTLLLTAFKDYARRLENTSRLVYMIGILILMRIFLVPEMEDSVRATIFLVVMIPFLAAFAVGDVTARGKEVLFLYRRSPFGDAALVRSKLVQGWVVVLPIAVASAAATLWGVPGADTLLAFLAGVGAVASVAAANVAFVLGFRLLIPVFTDQPQALVVTAVVLMMVTVVGMFPLLVLFGDVVGLLMFLAMLTALGVILMLLGMRHLRGIE